MDTLAIVSKKLGTIPAIVAIFGGHHCTSSEGNQLGSPLHKPYWFTAGKAGDGLRVGELLQCPQVGGQPARTAWDTM